MPNELHWIEIKHEFDEDEITQLGRDIATLSQEQRQKEAEKKHAVSVFTAEINSIKKDVDKRIDGINNGYEYRDIQATMSKNYSTQKREYFDENGNLVKEENFKPGDNQRNFEEYATERESNGAALNDLFTKPDKTDAPLYQQVWYSQSLQQLWVGPVDSVLERPFGDDWTKIGFPANKEIIDGFLTQHVRSGGTLATVRNGYELYLKAYYAKKNDDTDEEPAAPSIQPIEPQSGPNGNTFDAMASIVEKDASQPETQSSDDVRQINGISVVFHGKDLHPEGEPV